GGMVYISRRKGKEEVDPEVASLIGDVQSGSPLRLAMVNLLLVIGGLVLLGLGSNWLVESSVTFARWLEISEVVIGLTVIAIGTSLPEVVTSVIASLRGERDIAVGNIVGSNLFNLLGVLG